MISIVGAGPVGSYLAYLLAKKGEDVQIFEEHSEVGKPVSCSATFTSILTDIIPLSNDMIINKIKRIRLVAPNNDFVEVKLKKEDLVLNRDELDRYLVDMAVEKGTKLFLNHRFLDFKKDELVFKDKRVKTDILVGADGPLSKVAKVTGLFNNREFLNGIQARIRSSFDKDTVICYFDGGEFSWIIPENEFIARVGVACRTNYKDNFNRICDKLKPDKKILEYQSGLIPLYDPKARISKENIFLIGDAATMVKATTHGGIIPGLLAAKILANDFYNYEERCKKEIGRDLRLGLLIRKTLNKFSDKDYNYLISLFKQEKLKGILEIYERDFPSKFLFKVLLREPKLLKYGLKLF